MNPRAEYDARLATRRASLAALERRHQLVGYARLVAAAPAVVLAGLLLLERTTISAWWLLAPLPLLFFFGGWLERLEAASAGVSRAIRLYERGIARIEGTWPGTGASGGRFLDEHHVYARDLDLFGEGSLFDLVSNARTPMGEETLARWLLDPAPPDEVRSRQQAVKELGPRLDFHERLAVLPEQIRSGVSPTSLAAWGAEPLHLQAPLLRAAAWTLSGAGLLAIAAIVTYFLALAGALNVSDSSLAALRVYFLIVVLIISVVLWKFRDDSARILGAAESATTHLVLLQQMLQVVEGETFASPWLIAFRASLDTGGRPPSWRIARLNRLMNIADMRRNWFMHLIGPMVLFDLHVAWRLEDWRRTSGPSVAKWLETVGAIEAIGSLAHYHYAHPGHVFPELVAGAATLDAEALGHPLLDASAATRVVTNDLSIVPPLQTLVISGSNMSGKSTFLRTVGINVVLAQAGGPVYASRMRLSPLSVGASIRIQDSLREGVSRFYAEILRLRQIVDTAREHGPALFLIDEFLHGTNSHDRLLGATALVGGLVECGAIGLITTHDLALTGIATGLGAKAGNVHFEDDVREGRLHYDYVMRAGIVSRSNALALMRSIGLDV